jgi:predicted acyltransferase
MVFNMSDSSTPVRYLSIDFFRGATIALMIVVNTAGTWEHVYPPLQHAVWHGCTPTDLVFPSFMFIIGVSMWFAFGKFGHRWTAEAGKKILKRTILLFLIGVLMYKLPFFWRDWDTCRIMGVPQRLALGYGLASVLVLNLNRRALIWVSVGILLLYWGLLNWFATGDPYSAETSAVLRFDKWLLGEAHLYNGEVAPGVRFPFDPEGVLSTLPSVVTVILGWLSGELMSQRSKQKSVLVRDLLALGLMCGFAGLAWDLFFPINKKLWTSSYVLYAGGLSMIFLAVSVWLIDIQKWRNGASFFFAFGANSLFAYLLSEVLVIFWFSITWVSGDQETNLQAWIYQTVFRPIDAGNFGSLLFALSYMLLCWVVCRWLFVRKIFIKI